MAMNITETEKNQLDESPSPRCWVIGDIGNVAVIALIIWDLVGIRTGKR